MNTLLRHHLTAFLLITAGATIAPLAASAVEVGQLRCEYLSDPLGIDTLQPRLSWVLGAEKHGSRGEAQSAYRILVASNRNGLDADQGDLWDSGKVTSDQSIQVRYAGKPLFSQEECFWKVRVWDEQGRASGWSRPARWSMGLLQPTDWHGKWLGLDEPARAQAAKKVLGDAQWIWFPEGQPEKDAPVGTRYFRRAITVPADRTVKQATLFFTSDNGGEFFINGQKVGGASDFHAAAEFDVAGLLQRGKNLLAASVRNDGSDPNPAGLIGLLRIEFAEGEPLVVVTDASWKSAERGGGGLEGRGVRRFGLGGRPEARAGGHGAVGHDLGARGLAVGGADAAPGVRGGEESPARDGLRLRPGSKRVLSERQEGWRPGAVAGAVGLYQAGVLHHV